MTDLIAAAVRYNRSGHLDEYLVEAIQELVGAVVDGDPGPETAERVRAFQGSKGLTADGKIGPATLRALSAVSPMILLILRGGRCSTELVAEVYPGLAQVIDLSYHQDDPKRHSDDIAWATLKARSGVSGVILKATEGGGYVDPQFDRYRADCVRHDIPWAAYHYAHFVWRHRKSDPYALTDARAHADHFIETVGADKEPRQLWLDLERKTLKRAITAVGLPAVLRWIETFLARVDVRTGVICGVYTSQGQVREYLGAENAREIVEDRPTWWAYYPKAPWPLERRTQPPKHPEGFDWDIWQYSGQGRCPGVQGDVDLNIVNGGRAAIERLFLLDGGGC